ncbi:MAG TPA: ABC transporter permease [Candidatus Limnocylindrales bacterium]|nr:ABC transporter permease [Candidatus Limnocylindrales bacterium]
MGKWSDGVMDYWGLNALLRHSITPSLQRFLSWGLVIWIGYLLAVTLFALTGSDLAPYDPTGQQVLARLLPPFSSSSRGFHWLGTDQLGRDLLSNMIAGARLTLFIGLISNAIGMAIGVTCGMLAGYYGGAVDRLVMRLSEAQTAMPMFLVAIFFLTVLGPTVLNVVIILPSLIWPSFARLVRAETLRLRSALFIEAAVATGATDWSVLWSNILPNMAPRIMVLAVIELGHVMLAEAGLSFLGVGVQPPATTWGLLIARGRAYLAVAWWLAIMPGIMLGLTVLALNMLSRRFAATSGSAA